MNKRPDRLDELNLILLREVRASEEASRVRARVRQVYGATFGETPAARDEEPRHREDK